MYDDDDDNDIIIIIILVILQRKDFPSNSFYVVVVVKTEDQACGGSLPFYPFVEGNFVSWVGWAWGGLGHFLEGRKACMTDWRM